MNYSAVGYIMSGEDKSKIQLQKSEIQKFCDDRGLELIWVFVNEFGLNDIEGIFKFYNERDIDILITSEVHAENKLLLVARIIRLLTF